MVEGRARGVEVSVVGGGMLTYASVCSGIEAPSVAWSALGWRPLWFAEIEPFPSAVLAHHHPDVPNYGDFTRLLREPPATPDVLVGGTPCQAFSVAGLRGGLADPRGNLALAFVALVGVLRPRWVLWENVPGVLSSGGGRDFGSFLGGLAELGYGFAYRVLDAQYFGLAQRRERVFVVASPGDWTGPAQILLEPEGVRRDPPSRGEAGAGVAGAVGARLGGCGADDNAGQANHVVPAALDDGHTARSLNAHPARYDLDTETLVAQPSPFDTTQLTSAANRSNPKHGDPCHPLAANAHIPAVALPVAGVRRLMPHELERLQGFPDGYTHVPYRGKSETPDGPRAKALGNSMATPVVRWIGARIELVTTLRSPT